MQHRIAPSHNEMVDLNPVARYADNKPSAVIGANEPGLDLEQIKGEIKQGIQAAVAHLEEQAYSL